MYISTAAMARPEMVDDGYRLVGTTADGLPKPEFHFVGSDTQIVTTPAGPMIIYQDSTSHELLVALGFRHRDDREFDDRVTFRRAPPRTAQLALF